MPKTDTNRPKTATGLQTDAICGDLRPSEHPPHPIHHPETAQIRSRSP
jgi:hypothetical protein